MEYLVQQNRMVSGQQPETQRISAAGKRVIVVGGGDTSADCLGNAHREGAASVHVVTHGQMPPEQPARNSWPDWPSILRTYPAHEEGGVRLWDLSVVALEGDGRVERVRLAGRDGVTTALEADLVLLAIGFEGPARDGAVAELPLEWDRTGIRTDGEFRTGLPGIFAAGDARRGASLIVWAIAEGRAAARSIHTALCHTD
jgi:glutamate synthase (NADPH/NADH) small chain